MASAILRYLHDPYNCQVRPICWESVLVFRKLVIALPIFINNMILRYIYIDIISIGIILLQNLIKPFKERKVNFMETFSLVSITIIANINAIKACFVTIGINFVGPLKIILSFISTAEISLVLIFFMVSIISSVIPAKWWEICSK